MNNRLVNSRFLKRFGVFVIASLALCSIMVVALVIAFQSDTILTAATKKLLPHLSQRLGLTVSVDRVTGNLLRQLSLHDLRVGVVESPLLSIDELSLTYRPSSLLSSNIYVDEIDVRGMKLSLERDDHGIWNTSVLQMNTDSDISKNSQSRKLPVTVNRLNITNSTLTVKTVSGTNTREIPIENIELSAGLRMHERFDLNIRECSFDAPLLPAPMMIRGTLNYSPDTRTVTLYRGMILTGNSSLSVHGNLNFNDTFPQINADIEVNPLVFRDLPTSWLPPVKFDSATINLDMHGTLDNLAWNLLIVTGDTRAHGSGTTTWDPVSQLGLKMKGAIDNLRPEMINLPGLQIGGDVSAKLDFSGESFNTDKRYGTMTVAIQPGRIGRYTFGAGELELDFANNDINIGNASLETPFGDFHGGLDCRGAMDRTASKTAKLTLDVVNFDIANLRPELSMSSVINADLLITMTIPPSPSLESVSGSCGIHFKPSMFSNLGINGGRIAATWDRNRLILKNAVVDTAIGCLDISCDIDRARRHIDLRANLALPKIKPVTDFAAHYQTPYNDAIRSISEISGSVDIDGRLSGGWTEPAFDITAKISEFGWRDVVAQSVGLHVSSPSVKKVDHIRLNVQGDNLRFRDIILPSAAATVTMDRDNIDFSVGLFGDNDERIQVAGRVDAWNESNKRLMLSTMNVEFNDVVLSGEAPAQVVITDNELTVNTIALTSASSRLTLAGTINVAGTGNLSYQIDNLDLSVVNRFLVSDNHVTGSLSGRGIASGNLNSPVVTGDLIINHLGFRDLYIDSASVSHVMTGIPPATANVTITGTTFKYSEHSLINPDIEFALTPDSFLFNTSSIYNDTDQITICGRVDGWKTPVKSVVLSDISWERAYLKLLNSGPVSLDIDGDRVSIDTLALQINDHAGASIAGFMDITSGNVDIRGTISDLDIASIRDAATALQEIDGIATGNFRISNSLDHPVIAAALGITNAHVYGQSVSVATAKLDYADGLTNGNLQVEINGQRIAEITGKAAGVLTLRPPAFKLNPNGLNLHAEIADVRLSRLPVYRPTGVSIDGIVCLSMDITGDLESPAITGSASITDGSVGIEEHGLTYETFSLITEFTSDRIVIEQLTLAGDNEGSLQAHGHALLEEHKIKTMTLTLTGDNIYVPYKQAVRARIKPELTLSRTADRLSLTGIITVLEGRINIDSLAKEASTEITVIDGAKDSRTVSVSDRKPRHFPEYDKMTADVQVVIPKNAWIKGQDMNVEFYGDLQLRKESGQPFHLVGPAKTRRGDYYFQGKLFKIVKGEATFIGLDQPDPILDIKAVTQIRKVNIFVLIGGTLRDVRLTLDSEPSMNQSDIISYLVFGQPLDSIRDQQAFNSERAALRLTGHLAAHELKNIIGDVRFIDTFTLDPGDDTGGGAVSVGKYVTPNVFVYFQRGFTADDPRFMRVNYGINKHLQLEAQIGDEKTDGVDMIWEVEF